MAVTIRVGEEDFDLSVEHAALRARAGGAAGAIASFVGCVRDEGQRVETLHLEHYPGMTERSIEAITAKAATRWALEDVVVIHRVGALAPGEQIVLVLVASTHRADAFAACEFIMDYLKTDAVFWKREQGVAGERWVESTCEDAARADAWSEQQR